MHVHNERTVCKGVDHLWVLEVVDKGKKMSVHRELLLSIKKMYI